MHESRVRAFGVLTPAPGGPRVTVSVDALRLERDDAGRVTGSLRSTEPLGQEAAKHTGLLLAETAARAGTGDGGLQSAVATVREWRDADGKLLERRTELLARVETAGGPVLFGTAGNGEPLATAEDLPWHELAAPAGSTAGDGPPADWRERPLVLRPSPAAVLVAGTAFSLTSRGGRDTAHRLAGRRVLPSLTLRDLPTTPSAHAQDDLGGPAQPRTLVDDGRIRPPAPLREGIPVGRAVWDHDSGACAPPPLARLELLGPDLPLPSHAVELVRCVEGLQRYHADGTVRLQCLARVTERPGAWFTVVLRGKPVHLLRRARGLTGPPTAVHSDSDVTTRSLVLAGAAELEGTGHAVVTVNNP
ncbi:hypothetical protein [Streptomyces sp. NBC_01314]|uniref:hypothetical protein n=1 Tax=Streptomyces sp. NBC_01314 TaxID=2903821 RepID=UPI00308D0869|nr:hypothetical protein OG622_03995 [Streptomyces sp. NBC_01314]